MHSLSSFGVNALLLYLLSVSLTAAAQCPLDENVSSNPQCSVVGDCRGLNCTPPTPFEDYIASYTITKCADPVLVNLSIALTSGGPGYMYQFMGNQTVHFGGDTSVEVGMMRNASHLDFQAIIYHSAGNEVTLFPETVVPLDPANCTCSSLQSLVTTIENVESGAETNCRTIDVTQVNGTILPCAGAECTLTVAVFFTYTIQMTPLPCTNQVLFVVQNSLGQTIVSEVFQGPTMNEVRSVNIDIFSVQVTQTINVYDYSMEIQTLISQAILGTLEIIPLHRVLLDKTQCGTPVIPMVTMATTAPPPNPPSAGSSYTCTKWFGIAEYVYNNSAIFRCDLKADCDTGLNCVLSIAHTTYNIDIGSTGGAITISISSEDYSTVLGGSNGRMVTLPQPPGSLLLLRQRSDTDIGFLGFELDLIVTFLSSSASTQRRDQLIPYTILPSQSESCAPLMGVIMDNPQCRSLANCSGLTCLPPAPFENYIASFTVMKCVDPVQIDLSVIQSRINGTTLTIQSTQSDRIALSSSSGIDITQTRNATHLDFQATIFLAGSPSVTLFPETFVPLDPAECMCSSLTSLATDMNGIHPLVETNCITTRDCTGVRCELSINGLGTSYYIEVVIIPCENAIEFLVENQNLEALAADRFQGPGNTSMPISIAGFVFNAAVTIIVHPYSMTVQGFLDGPLLVKTSIIPLRTISLDRTHCIVPEFPTVAMPTRFPPPDPAPSNAPTVCQSLSETAQTAFSDSPILHCQLKEACDSGLACILDIGQSEYSVDIELTRSSVVLTVSSVDGEKVYGEVRNQNTSVVLPNPEGTALMFNQTVDNKDTVGFSLQLRVSFLTAEPLTEELIPFTTITFPTPSTNTAAIVVPIVLAALILAAAAVALVVVLIIKRLKKSTGQDFDFQKMSDLQGKELENYVKSDVGNLHSSVDGSEVSVDEKDIEDGLTKVDLGAPIVDT